MTTAQRLGELEEQSKHLTSHIIASDIPPLERRLGEIAAGSQRFSLANALRADVRAAPHGTAAVDTALLAASIDSKATQLLAHKGFDLDKVRRALREINLSQSLEALSGLRDTDVDGYLQNEYQNMILIALQETKLATEAAAHAQFELLLERDRDAVRSKLLAEQGQHRPGADFSLATDMDSSDARGSTLVDRFGKSVPAKQGKQDTNSTITGIKSLRSQSKINAYITVIEALNNNRVAGRDFDLCGSFYSVMRQVRSSDPSAVLVQRCWALLFQILEGPITLLGQPEHSAPKILSFYDSYHAASDDPRAKQLRQQIADGARDFFEHTYKQWLSEYVRTHRAELGGVPSAKNEVRAFVNLRHNRSGAWASGIELINNEPFWAYLWTYIRCGMYDEAVAYTNSFASHLSYSAPDFDKIFPLWVKSRGAGLESQMKYKMNRYWNEECKSHISDGRVDKFKFALYKILGRCDLSHTTLPCMETADDHIWMQLLLVQEEPNDSYAMQDRLELRDVADTVLRVGLSHYKNPLVWFQMLLASGEFETAISELAKIDHYFIDAVHFAICLSYYGMLRTLPYAAIQQQRQLTGRGPDSTSVDLKSRNDLLYCEEVITLISERQYKVQDICFEKLIRLLVAEYEATSPLQALQYIFTLTLAVNRKLAKIAATHKSQVMNAEACELIREAVLKSRAYEELLGAVLENGVVAPGYLERFKKLIGLNSSESFNSEIISKAAEQALAQGLFTDSIHLENLAGGFEKVVDMLISQMTQELLQVRHTRQRAQDPDKTTGLGRPIPDEAKKLFAKQSEVISLSEQVISYYYSNPSIKEKISDQALWTCQLLCQMLVFFGQILLGDNRNALSVVSKMELFPETPDLDTVQQKGSLFKQLDLRVARFIPDMLVAVGEALFDLRESLIREASSSNNGSGKMSNAAIDHALGTIREKAEALMLYTASLGYSVQADTLVRVQKTFNQLSESTFRHV